jgi:hypothetical protein
MKYLLFFFIVTGCCKHTKNIKVDVKPSGRAKKIGRLNKKENLALRNYFKGQSLLSNLKIIKSKNYLEDISKFLAKKIFGDIKNSKVYFHNCPKNMPLKIKGEIKFKNIIVVLGPTSNLKNGRNGNDFLIYKFDKSFVKMNFSKVGDNYSCSKSCFRMVPHGRFAFSIK